MRNSLPNDISQNMKYMANLSNVFKPIQIVRQGKASKHTKKKLPNLRASLNISAGKQQKGLSRIDLKKWKEYIRKKEKQAGDRLDKSKIKNQ
jgi:hypothetical protein